MAVEPRQRSRSSASDTIEELGLRNFATICSIKALRGVPKLLPKIAVGGIAFLLLAYLWILYLAGISLGPSYFELQNWRPDTAQEIYDSAGGGLRIVVFGGGDVATPNGYPGGLNGRGTSWTEIMCQGMGCNSHISLVPSTDTSGGAIISNSLFKAALDRISPRLEKPAGGNLGSGLDYSWIQEHYPTPAYPDLTSQVNSFLALPRHQNPPRETLWVFNFGFWDVWNLAAMPRKLAMGVIDTQTQHLFTHIEHLYSEAQNGESVAFSDYYADANLSTTDAAGAESLHRTPFRILISRPFDITLTPGFESTRPEPPLPHTKAEQMRNAAFLTRYWDMLVQELTTQWLDLPDPGNWSGEDALDIDAVKAAVAKRSSDGAVRAPSPVPRREATIYDMSRYLRGLILESQLRGTNTVDRNGLGAQPAEDGFGEVYTPCVSRPALEGEGGGGREDPGYEIRDAGASCEAPREHLFWTEFTVHERAIAEVGRQAAVQLERDERRRRKMAEQPPWPARDGGGRALLL